MENTLSADPLIYRDMETIRETVARFVAQGSGSGLSQVIDIVVGALETDALVARLTGKSHIFDGRLSVSDAVQRARDLRELPLN